MSQPQPWKHSGTDCFDPIDTCFITCCVPCVTYGKVHHRLKKDPKLNGYSPFNGACCGYFALAMCCGFQWIMQMMQRGDLRHRYNLKGDGCTDCLCAWCCGCCDLIQQDKESEFREGEKAHLVVAQPEKSAGMSYGVTSPPATHSPPVMHTPPPTQSPYQQPQQIAYHQPGPGTPQQQYVQPHPQYHHQQPPPSY